MSNSVPKNKRLFGNIYKKIKQSGLTLLEVLIVLFLSTIIYEVLMQIYLHSLKSYQLQMAYQQMQTHSEDILSFLYAELKKARSLHDCRMKPEILLTNQTTIPLERKDFLLLAKNSLRIAYMQNNVAKLVQQQGNQLIVNADIKFHANEIVIITDCAKANISQLKEAQLYKDKQILILAQPLSYEFNNNALIGILRYENLSLINNKFYAEDLIHQRKQAVVDDIKNIIFTPHYNSQGNIYGVSIDAQVRAATLNYWVHQDVAI